MKKRMMLALMDGVPLNVHTYKYTQIQVQGLTAWHALVELGGCKNGVRCSYMFMYERLKSVKDHT